MMKPDNTPQSLHRYRMMRAYSVSGVTVEVPYRDMIGKLHPWTIAHMREASEASNSRSGVKYLGERLSTKIEALAADHVPNAASRKARYEP